jgi:hypothetical protein
MTPMQSDQLNENAVTGHVCTDECKTYHFMVDHEPGTSGSAFTPSSANCSGVSMCTRVSTPMLPDVIIPPGHDVQGNG